MTQRLGSKRDGVLEYCERVASLQNEGFGAPRRPGPGENARNPHAWTVLPINRPTGSRTERSSGAVDVSP